MGLTRRGDSRYRVGLHRRWNNRGHQRDTLDRLGQFVVELGGQLGSFLGSGGRHETGTQDLVAERLIVGPCA